MFCTNCGEKLPKESKYCSSCGVKAEPQEREEGKAADIIPSNSTEKVGRKKLLSKKSMWFLFTAVLILIVGISAGFYSHQKAKEKSQKDLAGQISNLTAMISDTQNYLSIFADGADRSAEDKGKEQPLISHFNSHSASTYPAIQAIVTDWKANSNQIQSTAPCACAGANVTATDPELQDSVKASERLSVDNSELIAQKAILQGKRYSNNYINSQLMTDAKTIQSGFIIDAVTEDADLHNHYHTFIGQWTPISVPGAQSVDWKSYNLNPNGTNLDSSQTLNLTYIGTISAVSSTIPDVGSISQYATGNALQLSNDLLSESLKLWDYETAGDVISWTETITANPLGNTDALQEFSSLQATVQSISALK